MDELLSLKWKNHSSTFINLLGIIRGKQMYTDVTLTCSGKFYNAHKMVLTACSDYFKEVFEHTECKKPVLILNGINSSDLEALLDYMYIGEVNVKQHDLSSLIKAAECLQIKGLAVADDELATKMNTSTSKLSQSLKKRKRELNAVSSEDTSDPLSLSKAIKTDRCQNSKTEYKESEDHINIVDLEESKTIVKTEFSDPDSIILVETKPIPAEEKDIEEVERPPVFIEQASGSHIPENYNSEEDPISEILPYQSNSSEWQDTELQFSYSPDSGNLDSGSPSTRENPNKCIFCNKEFQSGYQCRRHMLIHTGEKPFSCHLCEYQANQKQHVKRHFLAVHGSFPPIKF